MHSADKGIQKVAIIYNPFSGRRNAANLPDIIRKNLDSGKFDTHFWPTEKPDDVSMLTRRAIQEKADIVLAAGGDGTINQIASGLVNTNIALGFIPLGSGNGFARHFGIPMETRDALKILGACSEKMVDTVWINGHCMVNVGGVGFDAHISAAFANTRKRGLRGYVRTVARNLNYKSKHYSILQNGKCIWEGMAFMIGIANATQWGNNVMLHPGALTDDGIFNMVVLKKFGPAEFLGILGNLINGKLYTNKNSLVFSGSDFTVVRNEEGPVHVDGEPLWLGKEININIEPLSLKVLSYEEKNKAGRRRSDIQH